MINELKKQLFRIVMTGLIGAIGSMAIANEYLYKTRLGDNLWNITERHLNDMEYWSKLMYLNKLPDSDYLAPGTLVRIPEEWLKKRNAKAELVYSIGEIDIMLPNSERLSLNSKGLEKGKTISLLQGSVIRTGANALATIVFDEGSRLLLESNSELKLDDLSLLGDGTLADMKLHLNKGSISNDIKVNQNRDTRYEVITPLAMTSVRGTEFRVNAGHEKSQSTIAEVLRGKIVIASLNSEKNFDVVKGRAAIVDSQGQVLLKDMPKAPNLAGLPNIIERLPINITLPDVADIVGYRTIIVLEGENTDKPVSDRTSKGARILSHDMIKNGRYTMILSAIDIHGLVGEEARHDFILNARPLPPIAISPQEKEAVAAPLIRFKWAKSADAKSYRMRVAKDAAFKEIVVEESGLKRPEFLLTSRLPSGQYFWKVATIDKTDHNGPFSDPIQFKVMPPSPKLDEAKIMNSEVTLRWASAGEGMKYRYQVANDRGFENIVFGKIVNQNFDKIVNLIPKSYYFRMQVIDQEGNEGAWGRPQSFTVPSGLFKDYLLLPLSFLK